MGQYKYTIEFAEGLQKARMRSFFEALNLTQLGNGAVSGITKKALDRRLTDPEVFSEIRVIEAKAEDDQLTVYFNCTPTDHNPVTVLTPSARPYQGTFYNVMFVFSGVSRFGDVKDVNVLKNILKTAPVKVYANDPSFYWQGAWEDLEKHDGAAFKFPGPAGDGTWRNRHAASGGLQNAEIRITKHMAQIIDSIDDFAPEIEDRMGGKAQPVVNTPTAVDTTGETVAPEPLTPTPTEPEVPSSARDVYTVPGAETDGKLYRVQGASGEVRWIKAKDRNQARYAYSKSNGSAYLTTNAWRDDEVAPTSTPAPEAAPAAPAAPTPTPGVAPAPVPAKPQGPEDGELEGPAIEKAEAEQAPPSPVVEKALEPNKEPSPGTEEAEAQVAPAQAKVQKDVTDLEDVTLPGPIEAEDQKKQESRERELFAFFEGFSRARTYTN